MELFKYILHFDVYLKAIIEAYGALTYLILFLIIFAETGLVVTPFLPGDSLIFVAGTLAGGGLLNLGIIYIILLVAAVLGDTVNYWIGKRIGPRVFARENSRLFKKEYLIKTHAFYEKHGGKTIILARFVPIVRTFAPFVAGVGEMNYRTFISYNAIGGLIWVTSLTLAGYFFGGLPIIKNNFEYVVIGIVFVSLLPMVIEYIKHKQNPKQQEKQPEHTTYQDIQKTMKKTQLKD